MVVHLKLNIYLSSMFLRENFITAMIANPIMLLYRACRLEIINQESRSIRINPVLRLTLSVPIERTFTCNLTLSAFGEAENSIAANNARGEGILKKTGHKFTSLALIYNSNGSSNY